MARKTIKEAKADLKEKRDQKWKSLRRKPKFIKDFDIAYKEYCKRVRQKWYSESEIMIGFLRSPEADTVARKYGLKALWYYNDSHTPVFTGTQSIEIIPHNRAQILSNRKLDISPHLNDGRFLTVKIDLYKRKYQITAEISDAIDRYLPHANRQAGRGPALDDECFRVYDLRVNQDKKFTEIMHELYPDTRGQKVSSGGTAAAKYAAIHRAFKKAKSTIQK